MLRIENDGERITAYISGELDHHTAAVLRAELDAALENFTPNLLIMDFSDVPFMDSSGIGLILGRLRVMTTFGGRVLIKNTSPLITKIIKLAGLGSLIISSGTVKIS